MSYMTLLHEKTPYFRKEFVDDTFFTLFVLLRASDKHYISKYWGDGCMGRPHLKFGDRVPSLTLGLRSWKSRRVIYTIYLLSPEVRLSSTFSASSVNTGLYIPRMCSVLLSPSIYYYKIITSDDLRVVRSTFDTERSNEPELYP